MKRSDRWHQFFQVAVGCVAVIGCVPVFPVVAQVTLDGTLGRAETLTGPNYTIRQEDGTTVGTNLFHSFGQFNLNLNETARFVSDVTIRNILARVTGGSPSSINGLIITDSANVNLFLINPNGITFGPNAQISVGGVTRGSFVATTMDALIWQNGSQFSATNPSGRSSLLNIVGDPSGFIASQRIPGAISMRGSLFEIPAGQSLVLLGGVVSLNGADIFVDPGTGGRVELGAVGGAGTVGLNTTGNQLRLQFPDSVPRANVAIANSSINLSTLNGGGFGVTARNIDISRDSTITVEIPIGSVTDGSRVGDITLNATGLVSLRQDSEVTNQVVSLGSGASASTGDIAITANALSVTDGSFLVTRILGEGNAGNVLINVRNGVVFDGESPVNGGSSAGSYSILGTGTTGDVRINAGSLTLTNGGVLGSIPVLGQGRSGSVLINARDVVTLDGTTVDGSFGGIISSIVGAAGQSGDIQINTGSLFIRNGAILATSTAGFGDAGNIVINARDRVVFDGQSNLDGGNVSGASTKVVAGAEGKGGEIRITTGSLQVTNGAALDSSTEGVGDAGSIVINARDAVVFDGFQRDGTPGGAVSSVFQGEGRGGDIRINSGSLGVTNGAILATGNFAGKGDAGNIAIATQGEVLFRGVSANGDASVGISSAVFANSGGGGNIQIDAGSLTLADGAGLLSSSVGQGRSGNLTINTRGAVAVTGGSGLYSLTTGTGSAGNIAISARGDLSLNNGNISAGSASIGDAFATQRQGISFTNLGATPEQIALLQRLFPPGAGSAGNIDITARSVLLDQQSTVSTESTSGNGGNIQINTPGLLLMRRGSRISTSAGTLELGGSGGNIRINSLFIVGVRQEDSDISANAFTGNGGNINITTQGIFGLQFRPRPTPFSDITASSQFGLSGTVTINTPEVDPNRGLVPLPVNIVDPSRQIAQGCTPSNAQKVGSFVVTGRGGLPPAPTDPLQPDATSTDWVTVTSETTQRSPVSLPAPTAPSPIQEAQGFVQTSTGAIYLVSQTPNTIPISNITIHCNGLKAP